MRFFTAVKSLLAFATVLIATRSHAQHPRQVRQDQLHIRQRDELPEREVLSKGSPIFQARTSMLNAPLLGHAPNMFGTLISSNNCVYANDSTHTVIFLHRSDPALFGGESGELRYDLSTDRGLTWTNDIGVINPSYGAAARYPNISAYEPIGNTSPTDTRIVYQTSNTYSSVWERLGVGTGEVTTGLPMYQEAEVALGHHNPGGAMCEGRKGEYWKATYRQNSSDPRDTLLIFKGIYSPGAQSVSWAIHQEVPLDWSRDYNAQAHSRYPSVAFSPDGNVGWIGWLGDLDTLRDSTYSPIMIRSTDGGATWGNAIEVDLNSFPWVYDSLRLVWTDTSGQPVSSGRATGAFQHDLTVDANGNPHLFFMMTSYPDVGYSIYTDLTKYMVDLTSANQGQTFDLQLVAPCLTYEHGPFIAPELEQSQNYPQVSRSRDGLHVFFSWIDTDTSIHTVQGVGYGSPWNNAPDLWISGYRITDGYRTCVVGVTTHDSAWYGRVAQPQMAPIIFSDGSGPNATYQLPVVCVYYEGQLGQSPVQFHYLGLAAVMAESQFIYPTTSNGGWPGCFVPTGVKPETPERPNVDVYPNPTNGRAIVRLGMRPLQPWSVDLYDLSGRRVHHAAGIETSEHPLDVGSLPAGAYLYRVDVTVLPPVSGKLIIQ